MIDGAHVVIYSKDSGATELSYGTFWVSRRLTLVTVN
jgi:hypothetical protein